MCNYFQNFGEDHALNKLQQERFEQYKEELLSGIGPKTKEIVLAHANQHGNLTYEQFMELVRLARLD